MAKNKKNQNKKNQQQKAGDQRSQAKKEVKKSSGKSGLAGLAERSPILLFIVGLGALMALFYFIWVQDFVQNGLLMFVNTANATIANFFLNVFGYETVAAANKINNNLFTLEIKVGCDAIEPIALFTSAVLAFPVAFAKKIPGILMGVLFLLIMNIVRIVSLFFVGLYWPEMFEAAHVEIWQIAFIILAILCWFIWLQTINKPQPPPALTPDQVANA